MEILSVENFTFKYPEMAKGAGEKTALRDINLSLESGSFNLVCGRSGSGKTTLLRQIKPSMASYGSREGSIKLRGRDIYDLDQREEVEQIGFVQQSPQNQVVTDKVWHELAFGLESLGLDQGKIRLRVGEIASFFNMEPWFYRDVKTLSGGQLQIMNLASVMAMQPELLILDEPTSQLDPIAARDFFVALKRINEELGITIILSEHRLGDVFPLVDRVFLLDNGSLTFDGTPQEMGDYFRKSYDPIVESLPVPVQIYTEVQGQGACPLNVREGRTWLSGLDLNKLTTDQVEKGSQEKSQESDKVLELQEVYFRYAKDQPDVLKHLTLAVERNKIHCILGGNGSGKSTTLKLLAGMEVATRGRKLLKGDRVKPKKELVENLVLVPQDPKVFFAKKTVEEELLELGQGSDEENRALAKRWADIFGIHHLYPSHPYDISGGEQQRLAIAKVLMAEPEIILMDEPTKGMDGAFKQRFHEILEELKQEGLTIVIVSHDVEFCALAGDEFSLLFNGEVIASGDDNEFFQENYFYTTEANKMCRPWNAKIITPRDAIEWIKMSS